ncbi:MAG: hypothetical protein JNL90_15525 [Planctomycetes bacterium]|nr:hypothetical protein [Planctomycetota bacterium]
MPSDPITGVRPRFLGLATPLLAFSVAPRAAAQEFPESLRGDEVGPREMDLDAETFLNLLSFAQPLESVQPFLAADSAWQLTLGSLNSDTLWYDQQFKFATPLVDAFGARFELRQGLDFDGSYTRVGLQPELALGDHWTLGAPLVLDGDKGAIDAGMAWTWRDPGSGCDFVQLAWMRADSQIDARSDRYEEVEVAHAAHTFSVQAQGAFLPFGKTTLRAAVTTPSEVRYVDAAVEERLQRARASLLQSIDWSATQRGYLELEYEVQSEQAIALGPEGLAAAFEGDRDLFRSRVEWQRDLPDAALASAAAASEPPRRLRVGGQFLAYREDAESPARFGDLAVDESELRTEWIGYAGWRAPLFDSTRIDCETVLWLDRVVGRHRARTAATESSREPAFQGKLSFFFRWQATPRADLVLSPSFELDTIGWGGGAVMLRCQL